LNVKDLVHFSRRVYASILNFRQCYVFKARSRFEIAKRNNKHFSLKSISARVRRSLIGSLVKSSGYFGIKLHYLIIYWVKIMHDRQLVAKIGVNTLFILIGLTGLPSQALDFTFSFDNDSPIGNAPGTVSGTIFGLNDNQNNQPATSIAITSLPVGLGGIFEQGNNPLTWDFQSVNKFSVSGGIITAFNFAAQSSGDDFFSLNSGGLNSLTLNDPNTATSNNNGLAGVTLTPVGSVAVPFEFSPTLGIFLIGGLWGTKHLVGKLKPQSVVEN
jgi:hypothetical protein